MKRPNLSVAAIASTLALMGCSKRASDSASPEQAVAPLASTTSTAAAAKEATPPPPPMAAPSAAASGSAMPGSGGVMKRDINGKASCGAGNCATDPKKK